MGINIKRAKVSPQEAEDMIKGGGSVASREEKVDSKDINIVEKGDVRFTVTMPFEMASEIDSLRKPTKTSRQAWLMQAADERLKRLKKSGDL